MHPQVGNVTEDSGKASSHKQWAVLQVEEARSNLTGNSDHFPPQAGARSINARASSRAADVLAWESSADDVDEACPRTSIERAHVVPDREGWQQSIGLPAEEHGAAVGINLDSASGAPSKEVPSQDAASCPCKKCQLIHSISGGQVVDLPRRGVVQPLELLAQP